MELTADCTRCVGLCCVVLPFSRSADFAFDKPAGTPCRHLAADARCGIHDRLRESGMRGCVAYDCFGAGQSVTETDRIPHFLVVEQVHEIAWYLADATDRGADVAPLVAETERLAASPSPSQPDVDDLRSRVAPALRAVAEAARSTYDGWRDLAGADLAGADLRDADLRGADLRGAVLLGADLTRSRPHRRRPAGRRPPGRVARGSRRVSCPVPDATPARVGAGRSGLSPLSRRRVGGSR